MIIRDPHRVMASHRLFLLGLAHLVVLVPDAGTEAKFVIGSHIRKG